MKGTLLVTLLITSCATDAEPFARAYQIEDLSQGIGGPKAMAREGDFVLENDRIRLAIRGARPSMGPHTSGGGILDADLQRNDPRYTSGEGNDQLAEMFSTVNLNNSKVHEEMGSVQIIADGSDGGAAIVCAEGPAEPFISLLSGLWALLGGGDFRIRTDYVLEPGDGAAIIRTYAVYGDGASSACDAELNSTPAQISEESLDILTLALEEGAVLGDFYLQGGSVDVFAPDIGFDEETYVYDLSQAGINTFQEPIAVDFLAGAGDGVSYGLMAAEGKLFVPMFTSSQTVAMGAGQTGDGSLDRFPDGTVLAYERYFTVGRGDVGSAVDSLLEMKGAARGRVQGYVVEEGTGVALSDVHVFAYRSGAAAPWLEWTTDVGDDPKADGSFGGTLPPGEWELQVYATGRPLGERVPVTVEASGTLDVVLASPQPASIQVSVVDERQRWVPAKVTFFREDGSAVLIPMLGDSFIGGQPAEVVFLPYGQAQIALPPGEYYAIASRGIEYELGVSEPFTVSDDGAVDIQLQVVHSVDTSGWIAADLHVHSVPSHDSGVSLEQRVATMVSEGVEFFASTDHDAITDFDPVIEDMGLETWVRSAVGLEVTTIELGHFLGFPLLHDYLGEAGLALDWTGLSPQEIIDGTRDLGLPGQPEPVVFVGHPRDGILGYFDQYSLNTYQGSPGQLVLETSPFVVGLNPLLDPDLFSTDFDALELLNGKRFEILRTPTQPELDGEAADPGSLTYYDLNARTMEEQEALISGVYTLGYGHEGQIDDWFSLLNLGFRYTALGNSDTHDKTGVESGCPRNFIQVDADDPAFVDPVAVSEAVKAGRVVTSYGPFLRVYANGDPALGPGSDVKDTDSFDLTIEVQAPTWIPVDRVEIYENGTLIQEFNVDAATDTLVFAQTVTLTPTKDSWYVVIALGDGDLGPVFTRVEIPPVQLQDVVSEVLGDLGNSIVDSILSPVVPIPRAGPVLPFALANPIYIDHDGDGSFTPPGLPDWLTEPVDPTAEEEEG